MKSFFNRVLATIIGIWSFVITLIIIILIISTLTSQFSSYKNKSNSILHIKLKGILAEEKFVNNPLSKENKKIISLKELKETIKWAKDDSKIKGIRIDFEFLNAGWAHLEDLRNTLLNFKTSGKLIVCNGEVYTNKSYYLATVASSAEDKIYLSPEGMFFFPGMSISYSYFRGLLDKLKIKPLEFHVGEYKSFGEVFYRKNMSANSRKQTSELLFHINDHFLNTISLSKSISKQQLKNLSSNLLICTPQDAQKHKLVKLGYESDLEDYIKEKLSLKKEKDINYADYKLYHNYMASKKKVKFSKNQIAVILAEGDIKYGKGTPGESIGSKDIIKIIKKIRDNDKIKAAVLRINSRGGSVIASDKIWHELMLLKAKKPLIASFSNVAASGGYYIATACDYIFAQETTITGSIGVLAVLFDISKLMEEYLGIYTSTVKTDPSSDIFSGFYMGLKRELTEVEKNYMQNIINSNYQGFIKKVSQSRNMSLDNADKLGRGRVWTGLKAKELGLVNNIGTLEDAIELAAKKANLGKKYSVKYWPEKKTIFEVLLEDTSSTVKSLILEQTLKGKYKQFKKAKKLSEMNGVLAIMPYDIEIN